MYNFVIPGAGGQSINFNDFRNKKILLVNIATGSDRVAQLGQLQQLQEQYADSLVVIGFPSNSFGNETRNNAGIKEFCESQYGVSFLLTRTGNVKGTLMQTCLSMADQRK
ncbi:MAG: hypothetical protein WDO16_02200 [Bacteroidota bacterium]